MTDVRTIEVPSRKFGKYVIRSRLGVGGMAEVFLADAVDSDGQQFNVALKLMKKGVSDQAFADEADLMGMLHHPNIVERLEVGLAFGRPYIAMEFLIGGDLRELISAHGRSSTLLPRPVALYVVIEVLKALSYFHNAKTRSGKSMGLIHGDVNPANVFFAGSGAVKLGDFGVAKSHQSNIGPRDGIAAGKLHYLSPEQTRGDALTPPSDLFAVGGMLVELLTGEHPFRNAGSDPRVVATAIRAAKVSLPSSVDKVLAQIIKRAMHSEVSGRYKSAGQFAGELFAYVLDRDLNIGVDQVKAWLEETLGLAL